MSSFIHKMVSHPKSYSYMSYWLDSISKDSERMYKNKEKEHSKRQLEGESRWALVQKTIKLLLEEKAHYWLSHKPRITRNRERASYPFEGLSFRKLPRNQAPVSKSSQDLRGYGWVEFRVTLKREDIFAKTSKDGGMLGRPAHRL